MFDVACSDTSTTLHVPQIVLRNIPFFESQLERWNSGQLRVELPSGLGVADLELLLQQVVFGLEQAKPKDAESALRLCQLTSMLNCDASMVSASVSQLRNHLRRTPRWRVALRRRMRCPKSWATLPSG
ncbi:unnamed protein product [Effrenium voratum]|nr:unnamed protein product [Effrenium voratum]CAJ1424487.1 unnamed protein product [Effrenium voratum]